MLKHSPSYSDAITSRRQIPQDKRSPRYRQCNSAVIRLTMAGFRAAYSGDAELAELYFAGAEVCARANPHIEVPLYGYVTTGDGLRFRALRP